MSHWTLERPDATLTAAGTLSLGLLGFTNGGLVGFCVGTLTGAFIMAAIISMGGHEHTRGPHQ